MVSSLLILIGQALCSAFRKAFALAAVLLVLNCTNPACGPADDHKQVALAALVLNLGQVLRVHVHIAWLVALEGLVGHGRLTGLEVVEVACPMSAQAPVQAGARAAVLFASLRNFPVYSELLIYFESSTQTPAACACWSAW